MVLVETLKRSGKLQRFPRLWSLIDEIFDFAIRRKRAMEKPSQLTLEYSHDEYLTLVGPSDAASHLEIAEVFAKFNLEVKFGKHHADYIDREKNNKYFTITVPSFDVDLLYAKGTPSQYDLYILSRYEHVNRFDRR